MAFVASYNSRLFVGAAQWASYARGFTYNDDTAMLDVTTLVDTSKQYIPGQRTGTVSLDLLLDTAATAGGEFATLNTWKGTPQVLSLTPSGTARSAETWLLQANQSNATVTAPVADVVTAAVSIQCDGGVDAGVVLDPTTAITATTSSTSVDNTTSTSNGGVAHLHVTAYSGLTSNTITVEHSTNNSTWATLGTFTVVSGTTAERLVIAAGTTVNRYLRVTDTIVGVGSCTRFVSFARR